MDGAARRSARHRGGLHLRRTGPGGDLSGLPPAYVECTSVETFRDEDVAYANRIWQAGGVCDLHVWAGGFHGVEGMVPDSAMSVAMRQTRLNFLQRILRKD